ncbi:MAG: CBS domain-containing protein [Myxococcota bacterium]
MSYATRTVSEYMTPLPHTIGAGQPLSMAQRRMAALGVRHLPVLQGGELVGVLSSRDVTFLHERGRVDVERVVVEDAMSPAPYTVSPNDAFADVVRSMAKRKVGSAVVESSGQVVGIVTTTDAMLALANHLNASNAFHTAESPAEIRTRILEEHKALRALLQEVEDRAERVLSGQVVEDDTQDAASLPDVARELYAFMLRHLDVEDRILAPALEHADGFGQERARLLLDEHRKQRRGLRAALNALGEDSLRELAEYLVGFVNDVRADMAREESDVLTDELLSNSLVRVGLGS